MSEKETWMPVPEAPGYEVSDQGRIRGVQRVVHYRDGRTFHYGELVLTPGVNSVSGYRHVRLKGRSRNIHTLVLRAFVGPAPEGMECRHLNGQPGDNRLSNLAWGTHSENNYDRVRHGTHPQAAQESCLRGHLLIDPNLTADSIKSGFRRCLACDRGQSAVRTAQEDDSGRPVDVQEASDLRYAAIMAGRPSGRTPVSGGLVGLDREWAVISTRRRSAHAKSASNRGVATCGRPVGETAPVVRDWSRWTQCSNCARLIVAGLGWA